MDHKLKNKLQEDFQNKLKYIVEKFNGLTKCLILTNLLTLSFLFSFIIIVAFISSTSTHIDYIFNFLFKDPTIIITLFSLFATLYTSGFKKNKLKILPEGILLLVLIIYYRYMQGENTTGVKEDDIGLFVLILLNAYMSTSLIILDFKNRKYFGNINIILSIMLKGFLCLFAFLFFDRGLSFLHDVWLYNGLSHSNEASLTLQISLILVISLRYLTEFFLFVFLKIGRMNILRKKEENLNLDILFSSSSLFSFFLLLDILFNGGLIVYFAIFLFSILFWNNDMTYKKYFIEEEFNLALKNKKIKSKDYFLLHFIDENIDLKEIVKGLKYFDKDSEKLLYLKLANKESNGVLSIDRKINKDFIIKKAKELDSMKLSKKTKENIIKIFKEDLDDNAKDEIDTESNHFYLKLLKIKNNNKISKAIKSRDESFLYEIKNKRFIAIRAYITSFIYLDKINLLNYKNPNNKIEKGYKLINVYGDLFVFTNKDGKIKIKTFV